MLILLPPSEGKTAPSSGPSLDLSSLSIPSFTSLREQLIAELMEVSGQDDAMEVLQVGKSVADEVVAQRHLLTLPTAPAHEVYTGVLYQAANFSSLSAGALQRAQESVLIFSALFGAHGPTDLVPRYRLKMGAKLPGGTPRSRWRKQWAELDGVADGQVVIDGRSGDYADWQPPSTATCVKVRAVRDLGDRRQVITHNAKFYRGLFARLALTAHSVPTTVDELAHLATKSSDVLVGDIELSGTGNHYTITIVEKVTDFF
ncbi:YaaA family protein [Flaviflexus massiliensis]|uniref:YaaA family protein n=1 Tax=Flaviflexus massiliensis TaxID=1522309 RepID=UPI00097DEB57|nr:peroxide stress protein YaaA [Flaviflexus massiliensis]